MEVEDVRRQDAILRVRIPKPLDVKLRTEARRLGVRPSELARLSLACGLVALAVGDDGQQVAEEVKR